IIGKHRWKIYRGMGSLEVLLESEASRDRYQQDLTSIEKIVPEGKKSKVPYKGRVRKPLYQFSGGLRKGMAYVGAKTIEDLRRVADFIRITNSGLAESHPHDVLVVEDPNENVEELNDDENERSE
ncbi:IMP dehydrogenase, partial [Candidatus Parcubacteria bacterium]|nr:IMP dehydrogenase [Candidatus Parcubacteria bacterium]